MEHMYSILAACSRPPPLSLSRNRQFTDVMSLPWESFLPTHDDIWRVKENLVAYEILQEPLSLAKGSTTTHQPPIFWTDVEEIRSCHAECAYEEWNSRFWRACTPFKVIWEHLATLQKNDLSFLSHRQRIGIARWQYEIDCSDKMYKDMVLNSSSLSYTGDMEAAVRPDISWSWHSRLLQKPTQPSKDPHWPCSWFSPHCCDMAYYRSCFWDTGSHKTRLAYSPATRPQ